MSYVWLAVSRKYFRIKSRNYRSNRPEVFCKTGVCRNLTKFTEKRICQCLFFNKIVGLRTATLFKKRLWHRCLRPPTLFKKRLWHRCLPVNFVKFLRTPFYTEHLCLAASKITHQFSCD